MINESIAVDAVEDHEHCPCIERLRGALHAIVEITDVVEIERAPEQVSRAHRVARHALSAEADSPLE